MKTLAKQIGLAVGP